MSYFYDQPASWSKYGIILYSDGPNVGLTYLENLNGKNWRMAPSKWYKISKKSDAENALKNQADPINAFSNTLSISHIPVQQLGHIAWRNCCCDRCSW
ncbi:unnamed protein product [Hanseniaspora opuntiae]